MVSGQYLEVRAGTTRPIAIDIKQADGNPANLTGLAGTDLKFDLSQGGEIKLSKDLAAGITITDAAQGKALITLGPEDTEQLSGRYSWLVMMTTTDDEIYDVADGTLVVLGAEPVTLTMAKAFLKVEHSEDDELIASLITAARQQAEEYTRRAFVTQTLELSLDLEDLFEHPYIELPRSPVQSIESINSYDGDDQESVMSSSSYRLSGDRVVLTSGGTWPSNLRDRDCIVVRYVAGYGAASAVPEAIKTAIKAMVAHAYDNRAQVSIDAGLPYLHPYKVYRL